jgi:hypothetical protein
MWWYYGHDAYYEQVLEYELSQLRGDGDAGADSSDSQRPDADWPIPLPWVAAWLGGLSVISLTLGLAAHWLLH